jgi:hypothetical protein
LKLAALSLIFVAFPIDVGGTGDGFWPFGISAAYAESGPGRDGNGGGDDDRRGRGGDDDGDDDDQDDGDDPDRSSSEWSDSRLLGPEFNISLQYANGWREWIDHGRYVLVDPFGRTVANRQASRDDVARMRALLGN